MSKFLTLMAIIASLALVACGDDDSSTETTGAATTEEAEEAAAGPDQAIAEIAEVRTGLDDALAAYEDGDAEEAENLASEAYLQHFELVEGPLEEADEELNEELEHQIREELRAEIAEGAPAEDVADLVEEIGSGLDEAEKTLRSAA